MPSALGVQGWRSAARRWLPITLICLSASTAYAADTVEVRKKARIYAEPDRLSGVIAEVDPVGHTKPLVLKLVSNKNQNGYLNVAAPKSGERGWIYKSFIRPYAGAPGGLDGVSPSSIRMGIWRSGSQRMPGACAQTRSFT